jgi:hypothetical protein
MSVLIVISVIVLIIYGIYGVIKIIGALLFYNSLSKTNWKDVCDVTYVGVKVKK